MSQLGVNKTEFTFHKISKQKNKCFGTRDNFYLQTSSISELINVRASVLWFPSF